MPGDRVKARKHRKSECRLAVEKLERRLLLAGPAVTGHSPSGALSDLGFLDVQFDQDLAPGSIDVTDVTVTGHEGPVEIIAVNLVEDDLLRISLPGQTQTGAYRLEVGPDIRNFAGQAMDQDADGTPGEAPEDVYSADVAVGVMFWASTRDGAVRIEQDGSHQRMAAASLYPGTEIVGNVVYACASGDVVGYDLQGREVSRTPIPGGVGWGSFVALSGGRFALLDSSNDVANIIDSSGTLLGTSRLSGVPGPYLQDLDGVQVGDDLIVCADDDGNILSIDLNTYADATPLPELTIPSVRIGCMAYDDGTFYMARSTTIYEVRSGQAPRVVGTVPDYNITGIAVLDGFVYACVNFADSVYRVDIDTGDWEEFATGLDYPNDIDIWRPYAAENLETVCNYGSADGAGVTFLATTGSGGYAAGCLHASFGRDGKVASVRISGAPAAEGLGIVISGATSVRSIRDSRKGVKSDLAFIASDAPVRSIGLKAGLTGYDVSGLTLGGITFSGVGETAVYCEQYVGVVKVAGDVAGNVWVRGVDARGYSLKSFQTKNGGFHGDFETDGSVAKIDLGGDFGSSVTVGGVLKSMSVKGGDFLGELEVQGYAGRIDVRSVRNRATGQFVGGTIGSGASIDILGGDPRRGVSLASLSSQGDLLADVHSAGHLGRVNVRGGDLGGMFDVEGYLTSVAVSGRRNRTTGLMEGGSVLSAGFQVDGLFKNLRVSGDLTDSSIEAGELSRISVKGHISGSGDVIHAGTGSFVIAEGSGRYTIADLTGVDLDGVHAYVG